MLRCWGGSSLELHLPEQWKVLDELKPAGLRQAFTQANEHEAIK
jgi:hypothetical protein